MTKGKVTLVGAGPGDAGLLTCKGREALEKADVVVYDRLVGEGVLNLIPPECKKIDVGKRSGEHPVPQWRINQILAEEAKKGQDVVRLKGGDCFLFGRGGEELEELVKQQVPFQVIPGITSALAAPAYGGIPVTHRDFCSSLHIITGHKKKDGELTLDYPALVRLQGTLVFLMSVSTAPQIAQGLLDAGMEREMPAAIIEKGTRPDQRTILTTLSRLGETVQEQQVTSPAILLVGKVASLSPQFDWFDALPLKGKRILVTRPRQEGSRLQSRLEELGAQADLLPAIAREKLPFSLPDLKDYTALLFTSPHGVACFFEGLWEAGLDSRALFGKKLAAVGSQTARALQKHGLRADFVPREYSGKALGAEMKAAGFLTPEDRALIPRAKKASPHLEEALKEMLVPYTILPVYETLLQAGEEHIDPRVYDALTFTSASAVEGFLLSCPGADLSHLPALCIGPETGKKAAETGMDVTLSPEATIDSMIDTLIGGFFHD